MAAIATRQEERSVTAPVTSRPDMPPMAFPLM